MDAEKKSCITAKKSLKSGGKGKKPAKAESSRSFKTPSKREFTDGRQVVVSEPSDWKQAKRTSVSSGACTGSVGTVATTDEESTVPDEQGYFLV